MRVLITGHRGFVGRHLAAALDGHDITGVDVVGPAPVDARSFFREDRARYDLVVHAAAHVGGRADIEGRPTFLGAYNAQLDGALFEWALRTRPAHLVYLSSSAVYPVALQDGWLGRTLAEDDVDLAAPRLPDATYGWTKLTGERLAAEAAAEGVRMHVVRPFSGYAADQDDTYPFPALLARVAARRDPVEVWGDGQQVRDWIHIDDVIGGILAAVEQGVPGPVNLCTGRPMPFIELVALMAAAAGYQAGWKPVGGPAGVFYRVGDPARMLGFYRPRVSLEEGIRRALAG